MFLPASQLVIKIRAKLQSVINLKNIRYEIAALKKDLSPTFSIAFIACIVTIFVFSPVKNNKITSALISPVPWLQSINQTEKKHEVFGFAPYWAFNKLDNVDFDVLTTLAYFGVPVGPDGNLDKNDYGYQVFQSNQATKLFSKAHSHGTRVVLTLTQMDNYSINSLMDSPDAQTNLINQAVSEVEKRGIDGVNIDFEYSGDPGQEYRDKFTNFVRDLTKNMHDHIPSSQVTVSVYAGSVKDPKIYDIKALSGVTDGIFMMAYDFAPASADNAMPTDPLYGHESGKYWYDIASAVKDFLKEMPSSKLILGVPWYGYNYMVYQPQIKSPTYAWTNGTTQTYSTVQDEITPTTPGISNYKTGWDKDGRVRWKSYYDESAGAWRMIFYDDVKSLSEKIDFAKNKNLMGIGMWALGFDDGKQDFWKILQDKFGIKLADNAVLRRVINDIDENI